MPTNEQVLQALSTVNDPEIRRDLVTLGMIQDVSVEGGRVSFKVVLTTPACPLKDQIRREAEAAVRQVPGVTDVSITFGANVPTGLAITGNRPAGIKHVIAVGSGKGGVGKSTVAVNLALALAESGAKVGLLDADIYGPSIPLMMGATSRPGTRDGRIIPVERHGVKMMSIGFMLPNSDDPVIWRGPMLTGVLQQFVRDVEWGEIDYLLVDLPPGTGDVPLSLTQLLPLSGAVIVITPQPVAAQIGIKTLNMFKQVNVPILGLIENMSAFVCPHCSTSTAIFDQGGGEKTSAYAGVPFLGDIPLDPKIRTGGDTGEPVFVAEPQSPQAAAFRRIAQSMAAKISVNSMSRIELPVLR
jgi:ATP-binding protein involved in chromosome partitioning